MKEVYIVSAVRTPMGSFGGKLAKISATKLGATAIKGALDKVNIAADQVDEVFMGNVLSAGLGQAPARQAAMFADLSQDVPCTTINKVCSSGMKSVMLAAQAIALGDQDLVIAGGMENMSAVPYYNMNQRFGSKLGDVKIKDGLVLDGLTDVYNNYHMGNAAELCAKEYNFSREDQDNFAIESYNRSAKSWEAGKFNNEIVPVEIPQRKGDPLLMTEDEEYKNVKMEKIPALRPVFQKDGSVTAANASTLNDGAAALVLCSKEKMEELGLTPIAKVRSYADAAQAPEWFTTAPSKAVPKAIEKAGISAGDVDFYELNEAFSVVGLANMKELGIDSTKTNVNGGAVSLGHPLGASGARITTTLTHVLQQKDGKYGCATLCNGGGGASAIVVEKI